MDKKLIHYTANEFLHNDSFLCWKLFPLESEEAFWAGLIAENPGMQIEIDKATKILELVNLNDYKLSPDEKSDMLKAVRKRIEKQKRIKRYRKLYWLSGVAGAAAILLFFLNIYNYPEKVKDNRVVAEIIEEVSNDKDIRLILADNEVMLFEQNTDIHYLADGNIIISSGENKMTTKKIETEHISYNKLVIPRGKRSFLILEDGTKVWVNSGSTIEFPAVFRDDQREVRVEGEIYIEVARDEARPFYVNTSGMKVEVLGTHFNVSAYREEAESFVVLVEGKVAVDLFGEKIELKPDLMLTVREGNVKTEKVNVYNYISWKDGLLQYSEESLGTILNRLSRYYNIPILYGEDIREMQCEGKLVLFDNIKDIMETIYSTNPVEYTIEDECIRVRKR